MITGHFDEAWRVKAEVMLLTFKHRQQSEHRAWMDRNPDFIADAEEAHRYDRALRKQAFFNGIPIPKHRQQHNGLRSSLSGRRG